jgi:DNA polymerase-3 subunit gamma/tau
MSPVRDRYKIFIIDEVHRLSQQAFDALLKSVEEPPPHVVFMMATTELEKVPATIQSRSQVFELKMIGVGQIVAQLRKIADAEKIEIGDDALMLIARVGDGSMRDAQSAFDQVIAFAGHSIAAEDVSTVLGLVRRELLMDIAEAVALENAPAMFDLAASAIESGYDLRLVVRELARLTRDLLVLRVDASRASDPEIAAEGERDRLQSLAATFSTEDLMRAFEVLTKAEVDIRASVQPRYHLEMALLRWIHLRKLVPLSDLIQGVEKGSTPVARTGGGSTGGGKPLTPPARPVSNAATVKAVETRKEASAVQELPPGNGSGGAHQPPAAAAGATEFKDAFLAEVRKAKMFFYGTVIAQAQRIDVEPGKIVLTFAPQHRPLRMQLDQTRAALEDMASQLAGRKVAVVGVESAAPGPARGPAAAEPEGSDRQSQLRQQALADSGVQAMLDVFAAEIKDVEEM